MRVLGTSNLYWESYSGHFPEEKKISPLQGVVRFCIYILPFALLAFPTIALYSWIIKVNNIFMVFFLKTKSCLQQSTDSKQLQGVLSEEKERKRRRTSNLLTAR